MRLIRQRWPIEETVTEYSEADGVAGVVVKVEGGE
jgi:hypothetical protein